MERKGFLRWLIPAGVFLGAWLTIRYLLPIALPFVLGLLAAMAAEPGVRFLEEKCSLPRTLASFLTISTGLVLLAVVLWLLGTVVYRELAALAGWLPTLLESLSETVGRLRQWAGAMADKAPEGLRPQLVRWVSGLFAEGSVLLEQAATGLVGLLGSVMGGLPGGAMLVGTAVLSCFMISAQLPRLRARGQTMLNRQRLEGWKNGLQRMKQALLGWLKAQMKLSGITFCILGAGFLLLRVREAVLWAGVVALVDALPLLGTGTILIPWALLTLLQGQTVRAIGLGGLYVTVVLVRSALEPRLVGSHLGINPLVTLVALYGGFRIWGIGGMLLAPILTVTVRHLMTIRE